MDGRTLIAFFTSWSMWVTIVPLILCSIIALAVIIERMVYYRKINHDYRVITENTANFIKKKNFEGARNSLELYTGPIAILIRTILNHHESKTLNSGVVLGSSRNAIITIEKNVVILATIATISPMLGLFGTVTGLLKAFMALYQGGPDASNLLAYGVAEALLTTIIGLIVAIPSWMFYNYCVSQSDFFVKEVEFVANVLGSNTED
ncbi:MAG: MotA/TolQ/ExbB proton channel family protein [Spirochaetes bacterium]|nr:MotA/TolQ/ExbB proton channel family protein [Spirochaetota bacterium]